MHARGLLLTPQIKPTPIPPPPKPQNPKTQHCAACGLDVARHDHHCVWLGTCVGLRNHARFLGFLCLHLLALLLFLATTAGPRLRQTLAAALPHPLRDASQVLRALALRPLLPLVLQGLFALATALGLLLLLAGQARGVLENVTTNERLNGGRYAWMAKDPRTGALRSRFDRGSWRANLLEFVGWGGYARDWFAVFELPPPLPARAEGCVGAKQDRVAAAVVAAAV